MVGVEVDAVIDSMQFNAASILVFALPVRKSVEVHSSLDFEMPRNQSNNRQE